MAKRVVGTGVGTGKSNGKAGRAGGTGGGPVVVEDSGKRPMGGAAVGVGVLDPEDEEEDGEELDPEGDDGEDGGDGDGEDDGDEGDDWDDDDDDSDEDGDDEDDGEEDDDDDDENEDGDDLDWDDDDDDIEAKALASGVKVTESPPKAPPLRRNTGFTGKLETEDIPFPTPRVKKFADWKSFREYWVSVWDDPVFRDRLRIYVYRVFPVMVKGKSQVCKLAGDASQVHAQAKPLTIQDILHRWGAGTYSIFLNDAGGPRGLKEVCKHILDPVKHPELLDYDNYTPVVDFDEVDAANPNNETFVRYMKGKNKWKSDDEQEETMKALELLERQLERGGNAKDSAGDKASLDLVAHAAKKSIDMITETAGRNQQSGQDGIAMVTAVLGMVKEMRSMEQPRGEGESQWVKLFMEAKAAEMAAQRENSKMMTDMAMAIVQQSRDAKAAPQGDEEKETGPLARLREMRELRDLLTDMDLFGSRRRNPAPGTDWGELMGKVLPLALPVLNTAAQAFAAWGNKQGAQIQAPQMPNPQEYQRQLEAMRSASPADPVGAPRPSDPIGPIPTPTPEELAQVPADFRTPEAIERFLDQIKDPLIRYINHRDEDGFTFADWYIGWKGEDHYEALASMGVDTLITVLSSYPPIWGELYSREGKVREFLGQFVSPLPEDGDMEWNGEENVGEEGMDAEASATATAQYRNGHAQPQSQPQPIDLRPEPQEDAARNVSPLIQEYASIKLREGGKGAGAGVGIGAGVAEQAKEAKTPKAAKAIAKPTTKAKAAKPTKEVK